MAYLFLVLFFAGIFGVIIAGETDSDSKVLWTISMLCLVISLILAALSYSTPDIYVVGKDNKVDIKSIYWKSTYTMKDGTVIELSSDSTYVFNEAVIILEQETVGYCEAPSKVGGPIPGYSLDTLTTAVLKYRKNEVYVFLSFAIICTKKSRPAA